MSTVTFTAPAPWQGIGHTVEEDSRYDLEKGIVTSGLDWEVEPRPLMTVRSARNAAKEAVQRMAQNGTLTDDDYDQLFLPDVKHRSVVRKDTDKSLGVIGSRWTALQNRKAFEWFQPFLDSRECQLHTTGALYDGSKIWVLAQLNKDNSVIAKDDEINKFILLVNSHDGTSSIHLGFTPIRFVCTNMLTTIRRSSASRILKVRHSKNMETRLTNIREIMNLANQEFEATAEQYRFLANHQFNQADLKKYVKICLKVENVDDDKLSTQKKNQILDIVSRIVAGPNQQLPAIRNTWWAAYNGVNEYLNHTHGRNTNNRLNSLWFGPSAIQNDMAFNEAMKLAS